MVVKNKIITILTNRTIRQSYAIGTLSFGTPHIGARRCKWCTRHFPNLYCCLIIKQLIINKSCCLSSGSVMHLQLFVWFSAILDNFYHVHTTNVTIRDIQPFTQTAQQQQQYTTTNNCTAEWHCLYVRGLGFFIRSFLSYGFLIQAFKHHDPEGILQQWISGKSQLVVCPFQRKGVWNNLLYALLSFSKIRNL